MIRREGQEGFRSWVEYGFRLNHKNHLIAIQRNIAPGPGGSMGSPWWLVYHLEGRGKNDPISMIDNAPLSLRRAEPFVRNYITKLQKGGK